MIRRLGLDECALALSVIDHVAALALLNVFNGWIAALVIVDLLLELFKLKVFYQFLWCRRMHGLVHDCRLGLE